MPTSSERTTVKAAIEELISKLQTNLVSEPPTPTKPFRRVAVGQAGFEQHPRPFLSVHLTRTRTIGVVDDDKLIEVAMTLRVVTDVPDSNPHNAMLDATAAVDDCLDSHRDSGIIAGSDGFDDREWTFDYPTTTTGLRVASADAAQSFVARVMREQNRVPAP